MTKKHEYKLGDLIYVDAYNTHGEFGIITEIKSDNTLPYKHYKYKVIAWEDGIPLTCETEHETDDENKYNNEFPTYFLNSHVKIMPAETYIKRKIKNYNKEIKNLKALIK